MKLFASVFIFIFSLSAYADEGLVPKTLNARATLKEFTSCDFPLTVPNLDLSPSPKDTKAVYQVSTHTIITDDPTDELLYHEIFHHLTARMSQRCRDEIMVEALTKIALERDL